MAVEFPSQTETCPDLLQRVGNAGSGFVTSRNPAVRIVFIALVIIKKRNSVRIVEKFVLSFLLDYVVSSRYDIGMLFTMMQYETTVARETNLQLWAKTDTLATPNSDKNQFSDDQNGIIYSVLYVVIHRGLLIILYQCIWVGPFLPTLLPIPVHQQRVSIFQHPVGSLPLSFMDL